MTRKISSILTSACIIGQVSAWAFADQKPQWKGTMTKDGDVIVVKNPKEPLFDKPVLSLREDYSIGGAQAKGEYVLSLPTSIAVDQKGNLYVLDFKETRIKVFDETGKFVRTIGRPGQGPGEIGAAWNVSLPFGSSELTVHDIHGRKLTFFSLEGEFLRNIPLRGMIGGIKIDSKGNAYLAETLFGQGPPKEILKKTSADMSQVLAEISSRTQDDSHNPFKPVESWVIDDGDRLIYGDGKTYEIRYYDPAAKLIRKILRAYDLLKVTKKDIEEFEKRGAPPGVNPVYNYSARHAAYRSFFADDLGHLFVQTWERTPDNRQDIHDIFDDEGRFIGRVALNRHEDLINPKVRLMRASKYYAIEPDAEGYEVIKRYSLSWNIK